VVGDMDSGPAPKRAHPGMTMPASLQKLEV
jgi:hypothetical protein